MTQGPRSSTAILLTEFAWNISVSAPGLTAYGKYQHSLTNPPLEHSVQFSLQYYESGRKV